MPRGDQAVTAFGAAANLVHPATGYSIARMLTESPMLAAAIVDTLGREQPLGESAAAVWEALWPMEKRRQVPLRPASPGLGQQLLQATRPPPPPCSGVPPAPASCCPSMMPQIR